jgi:hypothetical protein
LQLENGSIQLAGGLLSVGGVHQVGDRALGGIGEGQEGQGTLCRQFGRLYQNDKPDASIYVEGFDQSETKWWSAIPNHIH